ncbi:hypothetical protein CYY_010565 [Polysphondylium violaceum]|uniref:COP9 signalosome complex subunit 3 n=1 Tax=Polysphondylium violaceum TaxID=133409 RepID=A0A8J4PJG9_9MYCE|nr:hypothetical protein CYY_010565 [Polysphondylium violaceum]
MDAFVNDARGTNLKTLKTALAKYEDNLERAHPMLDNILSVLDPKQHSLGFLYVLKAKVGDSHKSNEAFINQVALFLANYSTEQVRLAPALFNTVINHYTEILHQTGQPIKGISGLKRSLAALSDSPLHILSPAHTNFLQLVILSKCYHIALPLIESNITSINPDQSGIAIQHILCYYYYAGIIFTALKKYKSAAESFKFVFTAPASALSAIAIEAYKKFVLVNLIISGSSSGFPRYTPPIVQRNIKSHCKAYTELTVSFSSNNINDIRQKAIPHAEAFQKDKNWGLVKLAIKSIYRRNIKKLTQTFMTLSIADIAEKVDLTPSKAEAFVLKMIEDGEIFASISQKDGMVSFHESPENFSGYNVFSELDSSINKVIQIDGTVKHIEEKLTLSQAFLKRMVNDRRGGNNNMNNQFDPEIDEFN